MWILVEVHNAGLSLRKEMRLQVAFSFCFAVYSCVCVWVLVLVLVSGFQCLAVSCYILPVNLLLLLF